MHLVCLDALSFGILMKGKAEIILYFVDPNIGKIGYLAHIPTSLTPLKSLYCADLSDILNKIKR